MVWRIASVSGVTSGPGPYPITMATVSSCRFRSVNACAAIAAVASGSGGSGRSKRKVTWIRPRGCPAPMMTRLLRGRKPSRCGTMARTAGGLGGAHVEHRAPAGGGGHLLRGTGPARQAGVPAGPAEQRCEVDPGICDRVAQADEGRDRVAGQDDVESGVGQVLHAVMPPGDVAGDRGQGDQQVRRHHKERGDDRAVAHLRGARERGLGRGDPLHDRGQRPGQVDRQQDQVETVDPQHVEALVAAVVQVTRHGGEVGQCHQACPPRTRHRRRRTLTALTTAARPP